MSKSCKKGVAPASCRWGNRGRVHHDVPYCVTRRGVVAVQVAVVMTTLVGLAALTVDVGVLYNTRADLQRTADAAALAAAAKLSDYSHGDPIPLARAAAADLVHRNKVFGKELKLGPGDVEFGRSVFNPQTGKYDLTPTERLPDAVRVRVRYTKDSVNGAAPLLFAQIFGVQEAEIGAKALAMMVPRDIAIVADLSASHNDDSELKHYPFTEVNLHEAWDAWPGGVDDVGNGVWDPQQIPPEWWNPQGEAPQAAGPAWGYFKKLGFGTESVSPGYDPVGDPGLVELPYHRNWSNAQLRQYLADRGYIGSEIDALMSGKYDKYGAYKYRVAAALGLAFWNSGHPGGLWERRGAPQGNRDNRVYSTELEWTERLVERTVSQSKSIWLDYINSYMKGRWSQLYQTNRDFRYRVGVKTFMSYLMERRFEHSKTPEFADTPAQPMQAVKDAVGHMVQYLDDLGTDDQLSLEIYGTVARHEVDLTMDVRQVSTRLIELQAGHYDGWTNMGGGVKRATKELTSNRARRVSGKMMILLTDGYANVNENGNTGDYPGGTAYALAQAQQAADAGILIFTVSVGANVQVSLMEQIAEIGSGEHFHAEGSIEEYSAQLEDIFRRLGAKRPIELIE